MLRNFALTITIASLSVYGFTNSAHAQNMDDNKVVRGETSNHVVRSEKFGTCVRTKWEAGKDICKPEEPVAEAPAPAPVVRTVLSKEEKTVYFNFDSAALTPEAMTNLDNVATKLSAAKDIQSADIVGYADRIGSSDYNVMLSRQRANAVKRYLADRGYVKTQVAEVRGLGEADSKTACDSNASREAQIACLSPDRRVEVELRYVETQVTQ